MGSGAARSPEASTARSYVLVGVVFYILGLIGAVLVSLAFLLVRPFGPGLSPMFAVPFGITAIFIIPTAGLTVWAWITYRNVEQGRYADARTAGLVLGILGLFFAWLIGGIFFLLAYGKLGEATPPVTVAQRVCTNCGRAVPPEAKFCAHCGKELPP